MRQNQDNSWLKVVPLGGLGHIGGNMMIYETAEDLIMVDCGVLFPDAEQPGVDYVIPDVSYVLDRERIDKLRGIVITHGHEDHIGALPFVLRQLSAPIYGTPLTCALIEGKLREHEGLKVKLNTISDRKKFRLGNFEIDPLPVTHSIPHGVAFALKTPVGVVIHTGDFKIDADPLDGRRTDIEGLREYGDAGVALLCSDSTNAEKEGHTSSERDVETCLREVIARAPARVFITTFASHIDRLQAVLDAAHAAKRKVIAVGRSMQQNLATAERLGMLRMPGDMLADVSDFPRIARDKIVVMASGSQGEPASSMTRIAYGRFKPISIAPGDQVIMSSRRIPGNERAIGAMINELYRAGAEVISDSHKNVHSSGHGYRDEQQEMLRLCRPEFFVPVHGEFRHLVHHAELAENTGVRPENIFITEDGGPIKLTRKKGQLVGERLAPIDAGLVFVDGKGIGDVGELVLRDRRNMAEGGMVVCVTLLSKDGHPVGLPDLITRGVVHIDANDKLLYEARREVKRAIDQVGGDIDMEGFNEEIRNAIRRFFKRELGRRPVVIAHTLRS